MPILKVFGGREGYKDDMAIGDLVKYPFKVENGYTGRFASRNLIETGDCQSLIDQMTFVNKINPKIQRHMDHFVISVSDVIGEIQLVDQIIGIVLNYFGKGAIGGSRFQIICAEHWIANNRHFHFILNHVSISGAVFYGRDQDYFALLGILRKSTGLGYQFSWASSSDYE